MDRKPRTHVTSAYRVFHLIGEEELDDGNRRFSFPWRRVYPGLTIEKYCQCERCPSNACSARKSRICLDRHLERFEWWSWFEWKTGKCMKCSEVQKKPNGKCAFGFYECDYKFSVEVLPKKHKERLSEPNLLRRIPPVMYWPGVVALETFTMKWMTTARKGDYRIHFWSPLMKELDLCSSRIVENLGQVYGLDQEDVLSVTEKQDSESKSSLTKEQGYVCVHVVLTTPEREPKWLKVKNFQDLCFVLRIDVFPLKEKVEVSIRDKMQFELKQNLYYNAKRNGKSWCDVIIKTI